MSSIPVPSRRALLTGAAAALLSACSQPATASDARFATSPWRKVGDAEWKKRLSPAAYRVLREADTERAGTSPLNREKRKGTYVCAGCELPLFKSAWKYESGTGWPSFWQVMKPNIGTKRDLVLFIPRTEYHCARCGGHQGHVFDDGPEPTGLRYCNNGVALKFVPG
ncbi:MAG TPA: peptide-methionine (R)-S-oxide reductase MsrB [Caulobacteraceae bacterium]|nr:peptide-methionine (R)-S-oxide reductase MsrB [Caulobacteraceae bacterium]